MTLIIGLLALASITWISGATSYIQESSPSHGISLYFQLKKWKSLPNKTIESVNTLIPTSGSTLTTTLEIEKSPHLNPLPVHNQQKH